MRRLEGLLFIPIGAVVGGFGIAGFDLMIKGLVYLTKRYELVERLTSTAFGFGVLAGTVIGLIFFLLYVTTDWTQTS